MDRFRTILLFILVCSFTISLAATVEKEFQETYDLNLGGKLSVENVNGKIAVESWDKEEVEVFVAIKVKANSKRTAEQFMEKVKLVVESENDQLTIRVDHPKQNGSNGLLGALFGSKKPNVSVQLSLRVPKKCDLEASSVNGSVNVTDVSGFIDLHTVNGKIGAARIVGHVEASTTNGSIQVEISELNTQDDMKFKTVNGSVKIYLPEDIAADLSVSTVNGSIHTDFPVEVQGKWGPKKIRGEINGGGQKVDISTVNGSVSLNSI